MKTIEQVKKSISLKYLEFNKKVKNLESSLEDLEKIRELTYEVLKEGNEILGIAEAIIKLKKELEKSDEEE